MRILVGYVIFFCLSMALLSLADETSAMDDGSTFCWGSSHTKSAAWELCEGQPTADLGEHVATTYDGPSTTTTYGHLCHGGNEPGEGAQACKEYLPGETGVNKCTVCHEECGDILSPMHTGSTSTLSGACLNPRGRGEDCSPYMECRTDDGGTARSSTTNFICTKICQPVVRMRLAQYNSQGTDEKNFRNANPDLINADVTGNAASYRQHESNVHCNFVKQTNCTEVNSTLTTCTNSKQVSCARVCRLNNDPPYASNFSHCVDCSDINSATGLGKYDQLCKTIATYE